jgi:hypothetical protein
MKKNRMIVVSVFVILSLISFSKFIKKDFEVNLTNNSINVNENYETIFEASFKGKDITRYVTHESKIDITKIGTYKVFFYYEDDTKKYEVVKKIKVRDLEPPEIDLIGGKNITIIVGENFKDPGYKAIDNYDGDITNKVKISGDLDTEIIGEYTLTYVVSDNSNNKTSVNRKIKVINSSPITMSIKEFTLDGLFEDTILKEGVDMGEKYTDNIIFAGDSIALYYVMNKLIDGKRLWHRESMDPEKALTNNIYINHLESGMTFKEAFQQYQPNMVIMTLGTNSISTIKVDYFVENYKKLIKDILQVSPNTKLIIQSIPPVDSYFDAEQRPINNTKINTFNYYIARMCSELGVKFLNSASAMKDENGQCKKGYCRSDGIHPTLLGNQQLMKYAQTHPY